MYFFKYNKYYINSILIDKSLVNYSKLTSTFAKLNISLYFLFNTILKDKIVKYNLLKYIFINSRLFEQLSSQRCIFKVVSYRWSLPFKDIILENLESKKEVVYSLFTSLMNRELIYFIYLKKFVLSKYVSNFTRHYSDKYNFKSFRFNNFLLIEQIYKYRKFMLPKAKLDYKVRIYFEYNFFKSEKYNFFLINLLGCI